MFGSVSVKVSLHSEGSLDPYNLNSERARGREEAACHNDVGDISAG